MYLIDTSSIILHDHYHNSYYFVSTLFIVAAQPEFFTNIFFIRPSKFNLTLPRI